MTRSRRSTSSYRKNVSDGKRFSKRMPQSVRKISRRPAKSRRRSTRKRRRSVLINVLRHLKRIASIGWSGLKKRPRRKPRLRPRSSSGLKRSAKARSRGRERSSALLGSSTRRSMSALLKFSTPELLLRRKTRLNWLNFRRSLRRLRRRTIRRLALI